MPTEIATMLQQALHRSAKSTALKPLAGLVAALLGGCILASRYCGEKDKWLVVLLGVLASISVFVFLGTYIFFALTDPDALRSEKFSIQKMAIQHGFIGDDQTGYIKISKVGDLPLVGEGGEDKVGKGGN